MDQRTIKATLCAYEAELKRSRHSSTFICMDQLCAAKPELILDIDLMPTVFDRTKVKSALARNQPTPTSLLICWGLEVDLANGPNMSTEVRANFDKEGRSLV